MYKSEYADEKEGRFARLETGKRGVWRIIVNGE